MDCKIPARHISSAQQSEQYGRMERSGLFVIDLDHHIWQVGGEVEGGNLTRRINPDSSTYIYIFAIITRYAKKTRTFEV